MSKKQKLELTWIGKDERPKLEPRILIEDPELSHHADKRYGENDIFDNILIQGDNLLALKALEQEYAGKVKCIYIDPPYNIDAATPHYEDGLEHSEWLTRLRDRISILKSLLSTDGLFFVQIDDEEMPYLTVLLDEVFGRRNRINIVAVKMSEASGVKMAHVEKRLPKLKEYVLIYSNEGAFKINVEKVSEGVWNQEYKSLIEGINRADLDEIKALMESGSRNQNDISRCNELLANATIKSVSQFLREENIPSGQHDEWRFQNAWRIVQAVGSTSVLNLAKSVSPKAQEIAAMLSPTGIVYLYKTSFDRTARQPRIQVIFADQNLYKNPGDFWTDIKTTGGVGQEGGVLFPNGKKPEALIKRIIGMNTEPGDVVLDSFAGSGTTAAVAHKMGRKWITVELGDHAQTHIVPRLKKVIDGEDQGGVTEATVWKGGGGYRFYRLAPSLLEKDPYGNWVISKEYDANKLSEAICKLMGFTYDPSDKDYWNHGYSTESDFIFVTTNAMTYDALKALSAEVGAGRSLMVCCKAFNADLDAFDNLTLKKIPHAVVDQCEWGKDDYSLNVQNLPMFEDEESDEDGELDLFNALEGDDA